MKYELSAEEKLKINKALESQIEIRDDAQEMIDMFLRMLE